MLHAQSVKSLHRDKPGRAVPLDDVGVAESPENVFSTARIP
jgi:hypothetical protein